MRKGFVVALILLLSIPVVFANTIMDSFQPMFDILLVMFEIVSLEFVTGEYEVYAFKFFYVIALVAILQSALKKIIKDTKTRGIISFSTAAIGMIFMPGDLARVIGNQFGVYASIGAFMFIPAILAIKSFTMWKENPHRFFFRGLILLGVYALFSILVNIINPDKNEGWIRTTGAIIGMLAMILIFYGLLHWGGSRKGGNNALANGLGMSDKLSTPLFDKGSNGPTKLDNDLISANNQISQLEEQIKEFAKTNEADETKEIKADIALNRDEVSQANKIEADEKDVGEDVSKIIKAESTEAKNKEIPNLSKNLQTLTTDFNKEYKDVSQERTVYLQTLKTYQEKVTKMKPLLEAIFVKKKEVLKVLSAKPNNERSNKEVGKIGKLQKDIAEIQRILKQLVNAKAREIQAFHDKITAELRSLTKLKTDIQKQTSDLQEILSGSSVSEALADEKIQYKMIEAGAKSLKTIAKTGLELKRRERHDTFFKELDDLFKENK